MFGYAGNTCHVNLSSGEIKSEPLDHKLTKDFIGGYGMNVRLAYEFARPSIDPLSPENILIIGAGPFSGTTVPCNARLFATTKLPVPGYFGTACGGGHFGALLKRAGYDNAIITGKAEKPVYLKFGDKVEICDATHLWGKDIPDATEALWAEHNPCSVICIGGAGERLVKISLALVDSTSSLGKGGLGAVMGSKNLKAIVACGRGGIKVANPKRFANAVMPLTKKTREDPQREIWATLGEMAAWDTYKVLKGMVYKNSTTLYPLEKAERLIDLDYYLKHNKVATIDIPSCPYPCHHVAEAKKEDTTIRMRITNLLQPLIYWGARTDVPDFFDMIKLFDFANRQGVDSYCTDIIAYATQLYELGIISKEDTDGLELKPGYETAMALLRKMAYREGIGDILGGGIVETAKRFGEEAEKHAVHIKGMGYLLDPRNLFGVEAFGQVVDPRGHQAPTETALTMRPGTPWDAIKRFNSRWGVSKEANERVFAQGFFNVGLETKHLEDWWSVVSSLPACIMFTFQRYLNLEIVTEIYSALTGNEMSPSEMIKVGERARNLERLLNYREGYTKKDDKFPEAWFEPLKVEGGEDIHLMDYNKTRYLTKEDTYRMLDDYYTERGWDVETGIPTKEKLDSLGLQSLAEGLSLP